MIHGWLAAPLNVNGFNPRIDYLLFLVLPLSMREPALVRLRRRRRQAERASRTNERPLGQEQMRWSEFNPTGRRPPSGRLQVIANKCEKRGALDSQCCEFKLKLELELGAN